MAITPLPDAPQPGDTPSEFNTKAFAWVDAIDTFTTEANALASAVDSDASAAAASAAAAAISETNAENASDAALSAANFKGNWSDLTGALNKPASVYHDNVVWMLLNNLANVTTSEPGVSADWVALTAQGGTDVQTFTTSGTWTKPDACKFVMVEVLAAGGGGASGARQAAGVASNGGFGGSGGAYGYKIFKASELAATETVVIGSGGTGGAAVTTDSTASNPGSNGGNTSFSGNKLTVYGGLGAPASSSYPIAGGGVFSGQLTASAFGGGGGVSNSVANPLASGFGGGGSSVSNSTPNGGASLLGGAGGGFGGSFNSSNAFLLSGSGGGLNNSAGLGGGGAAGAPSTAGGSKTTTKEGGGGGGTGYYTSLTKGRSAFGDSKFVIVAGTNYILVSSNNGDTWSINSCPANFTQVIHDGTKFIFIASSVIYTSTDLSTFTLIGATPVTANLFRYVNGIYFVFSFNSTIFYSSTNLVTWTLRDTTGTSIYSSYDICWTGSRYVVLGNDGSTNVSIRYSTDLSAWTTGTGVPGSWGASATSGMANNGNTIFVARVTGTRGMFSTDGGATWADTTSTLPGSNGGTACSCFFANGYFVATDSGSSTIAYSTNATNWTNVTSITSPIWLSFGSNTYFLTGGGATNYGYKSTSTPITWTLKSIPAVDTAGGAGGAGGIGSGGGGGGASKNGFASGAGGAGGNGYCVVYSW